MHSRLFHAIVISSASFAGGCSTDPIAPPGDGSPSDLTIVQGADAGVSPIVDMGVAAPDMARHIYDMGFPPPPHDSNMPIGDMTGPIGVAPIDGFGPPPDGAKGGFDAGVTPADMGMTIVYDMVGQKDLP